MDNPILAYRDAITSGEAIVGEKVAKLYDRLAQEVTEDDGRWIYDPRKANAAIAFLTTFCRQSKGKWKGQPLDLLLWQRAFVAALFGFIDKETGERRYTEVFLAIGRKCGKSTLAAGILLYLFFCEGQADIFTAATKLDQAAIIFDEASKMVAQSPLLRKRVEIHKRPPEMLNPSMFSTFKPLSRTSSTLDGLNASAIGLDEVHAWSGAQGRELYSVLKQSQSARDNRLLLMVTTAGTVRGGLFDDLYDLSAKVLDGVLSEPRFLPVIYEAENTDDWTNVDEWRKANPSLEDDNGQGIKKLEFMQGMALRAKNSPNDLATFLCKDLNVRASSTSAWLNFHEFNNEDTFSIDDFRGSWGIVGVDISQTTDLTAAALLLCRDGTFYADIMAWIPEDNVAERVHKDQIPYDKWHEQGLLRYCSGNVIDPSDITAWILEIVQQHDISIYKVGYDPYCSRYWSKEMEDNGFDMVRVRQGHATESVPLQNMGQLFRAKKINYNNNQLMKWCLSNAGVDVSRNGSIALIKAGQPRQRIDAVAALMDSFVVYYDFATDFHRLIGE